MQHHSGTAAARLHDAFMHYAYKETKPTVTVGPDGRLRESRRLFNTPIFRSQQFVKIVKDAGLVMPPLSTQRVDLIFTSSCVQGPGGRKGKKDMSLV